MDTSKESTQINGLTLKKLFIAGFTIISACSAIVTLYESWKHRISKPVLVEIVNDNAVTVNAKSHIKWVKKFQPKVTYTMIKKGRFRWNSKVYVGVRNRENGIAEMLCYNWNGRLEHGDTITAQDYLDNTYNSGICVLKEVEYAEDKERFVITAGEGYFSQNMVVFYDMNLQRTGVYYNHGSITHLFKVKDCTGASSIIICGVNNDLSKNLFNTKPPAYNTFIARLPFDIYGQSPPYRLGDSILQKSMRDKADWYRIMNIAQNYAYDFYITDIDNDGVADITLANDPIYKDIHINLEGKLINDPPDGFQWLTECDIMHQYKANQNN